MGLVPWQTTVTNESKNLVPNPVITVRNVSDDTLATLYSDASGTAEVNPITGDANGFVQFWAQPGEYYIDGAKDGDVANRWYWDAVDLDVTQPYVSRASLLLASVPANVNRISHWSAPLGTSLVREIRYSRITDEAVNPLDPAEVRIALALADGSYWSPFEADPEAFGAVRHASLIDVANATDSASDAIDAAFAFAAWNADTADAPARGILTLHPGYYRLTRTFVHDVSGIHYDAPKGTVFYIAHSSGAGVWWQESYVNGDYLEIRGDAARASVNNAANMGLRIEPEIDDAENLIIDFDVSNMTIRFHGGSGVVANSMSELRVFDANINRCLRHGLVVCNYAETGRTGTRSTGMVEVGGGTRISLCGGHRILVGASSGNGAASAYRVTVFNIDGDDCATDPTLLYEDTADFIRSDDVVILGGGYACKDRTAGITLAGRSITSSGMRFTHGDTPSDYLIIVKQYSNVNVTKNVNIMSFNSIGGSPAVEAVFIDNSGLTPVGDDTVTIIGNNDSLGVILSDPSKARRVVTMTETRESKPLYVPEVSAATYSGTGAQTNNTAGRVDPTIGKLMRVGGFLGGTISALWPSSDLNVVTNVGGGFYRVDSSIANRPGGFNALVFFGAFGGSAWAQVALTADGVMMFRIATAGTAASPTWGAWQTVAVT